MVGRWVLRDAYEFTPSTVVETSTERSWGQIFRLGGTSRIDGVAWYRGDTGTPGPSSLSVWDAVSGARVWKTDSPPDDGTIGWQEVDLSDAPLDWLALNSQPMVQAYGGTGTSQSYGPQSAEFHGEVPANVNLQAFRSNNSIGDQLPTTPFTGQAAGLDARIAIIPLTGANVVAANVEAELARWLREDGDHYDEGVIKTILGQASGANETVQSEEFGNAVIHQDTQDILTRCSSALATKLNDPADAITTALTVWTSDPATSIAAGMAKLEELWSDILACFASTPGALLCVVHAYHKFLRDLTGPPEAAWIVDAETDFTDSLEWPVQADQYRVFVETFDARGSS